MHLPKIKNRCFTLTASQALKTKLLQPYAPYLMETSTVWIQSWSEQKGILFIYFGKDK